MNMDSMNSEFSSQRSQFIQGCTGFAAGATAAVALRLFARWKSSAKLAWDDLSITLSLIPLWALAGTGVAIAMYGGLAQQDDTLTPSQRSVFYPVSSNHSRKRFKLALTRCVVRLCLVHSICPCNHSRKAFDSSPLPPNLQHPGFPSYALHLHGPLHRLVCSGGLPRHLPLQSRGRSLVNDQ